MSVDDPRFTDPAEKPGPQTAAQGAENRHDGAGSHDPGGPGERSAQDTTGDNVVALEPPRAPLSPAAKRALAEAEERRRQEEKAREQRAKEIGGRNGPDPVRYGDWEKGGICWDF